MNSLDVWASQQIKMHEDYVRSPLVQAIRRDPAIPDVDLLVAGAMIKGLRRYGWSDRAILAGLKAAFAPEHPDRGRAHTHVEIPYADQPPRPSARPALWPSRVQWGS